MTAPPPLDEAPPDEAPPPPSLAKMSAGMLALAVVGLAIPAVVIASSYKACRGTTTRGSVSVRGDGAIFRATISTCVADPTALDVALGQPDSAPLVRVLLDPLDGPRVEVYQPPSRVPAILTAATCSDLRVDMHRVGQRPDGSQLLDGAASASCRVAAGQVELDAWWRGCHQSDEP